MRINKIRSGQCYSCWKWARRKVHQLWKPIQKRKSRERQNKKQNIKDKDSSLEENIIQGTEETSPWMLYTVK